MYGELVPLGGGDPIPLMRKSLMAGRRESCDIVLRFPNVSAHHCEFTINYGYWYVRDLNSRNGVKVNNVRITAEKRLDPGDTVAISKHNYQINYSPVDLGAVGPPPSDETSMIFGKSLLERAGLSKSRSAKELEQDDPDDGRHRRSLDDDDAPLKKPPERRRSF